MNPDYSSDIRQVQRFIFEHNLYLLTMFQKKIDSFTKNFNHSHINSHSHSRNHHGPHSQSNSHHTNNTHNTLHRNIIDCDSFLEDPIKNLSRDLTKPIWNCITKVQPKIIYQKQSPMQPIEIINTINKLLHCFFNRLKNQHEDQSALRLNVRIQQFDKYLLNNNNNMVNNNNSNNTGSLNQAGLLLKNITRTTTQLFTRLHQSLKRQLNTLQNQIENNRTPYQSPQQFQIQQQTQQNTQTKCTKLQLKTILLSAKELLQCYLNKTDDNFVNELDVFNQIVVGNVNDVINCKIGSLVICLQPKLMYLPLFVHPMLIALHSVSKGQVLDVLRREELRLHKNQNIGHRNNPNNIPNNPNPNQNPNNNPPNQIPQLHQMRQIPQIPQPESPKPQKQSQPIYEQFQKSQSISKIVFINFDGYQSQFNIQIAKYMCKSFMYVSFPRQAYVNGNVSNSSSNSNCKSNNSSSSYDNTNFKTNNTSPTNTPQKQNQQIQSLQSLKSIRLLQKYYYSSLSQSQKQQLLKLYKPNQKQQKKNLYIFPLHSRVLTQLCNLPLLYNQQTSFISFIMSQIIYSQILEFNPSLIVISYSQKINIQTQYFVELMKQLTILGNYKIVFYANLAKNYMFEEYISEELRGLEYVQIQQKYSKKYQSQIKIVQNNQYQPDYSNIKDKQLYNYPMPTNSPSQFNPIQQIFATKPQQLKLNIDIFQKISIMLKISSGTYNLNKSRMTQIQSYIEKFRNYKALVYASPLLKKLGEEYQNLNKVKMRLCDYDVVVRVLENQFNNRQDTYEKLFSKVISKFHIGLFKQVQKIILSNSYTQQSPQIKGQKQQNLQQFQKNKQTQLQQQKMGQTLSMQEQYRRQRIYLQLQSLRTIIQKKNYNIKTLWGNFKFQRFLELSTEKIQTHFFAHIPIYRQNKSLNLTSSPKKKLFKKQAQNLICLQFYTIFQREKIPLQLSPSTTKIYYSHTRKYPQALIYLINHILKPSSTSFCHYYGIITQQFCNRASTKLQLETVKFNGGPLLTNYQTYTQFNYHESQDYIFMFWPKIYDLRKQLLSKYCGNKYNAEQTGYFFRAHRKQPSNFYLIYTNKPTDYILPRHGCQCYQIQGTNTIYIFGGFYGDEKNYLLFQTDITRIIYKPSLNTTQDPQICVENIPKSFYFDYKQLQQNREIKVITQIKNDMVRPKVQYQFLEFQNNDVHNDNKHEGHDRHKDKQRDFLVRDRSRNTDKDKNAQMEIQMEIQNSKININENINTNINNSHKQHHELNYHKQTPNKNKKILFLIGGIGQNFIRPYSMISHMAHKIVFNTQTGDIEQIRRIKMHNIIPINTYNPIKLRSSMNTKLLSNAQNRSINFQQGQSGINGYTIYHNNVTYNPQNKKFQYQSQYQFVDQQYRVYKDEISFLKKTISENVYKLSVYAKCPRAKQFNTNFISLSLQNQSKYILQLHLQLSLDTKYIHPDLPNSVRLTSSSIISIDVSGAMIYALIRHPIYTLDQCILTYFDLNQLSVKLKQGKPVEIQMKQLHKFDENVSANIVIAANQNTVLVVHGQRFDCSVHMPEMIMKRVRRKHLKITNLLSNQKHSQQSPSSSINNINLTPYSHHHNSTTQKLTLKQTEKLQQYFNQNNSINIVGGINCSIFINQNNGTILCFSFKSINRRGQSQIILFIIQKLELNTDKYYWDRIYVRILQMKVCYNSMGNNNVQDGLSQFQAQLQSHNITNSPNNNITHNSQKSKKRQHLKLAQIIQIRRQTNISRNIYELIGFYKDTCVSAKLQLQLYTPNIIDPTNFQTNTNNNTVIFKPTGKSVNEYYKQLAKNTVKQYSIYLEKNAQVYNQVREEYCKSGHVYMQERGKSGSNLMTMI